MSSVIKHICFLILLLYTVLPAQILDTTFSESLIEDILPPPENDNQVYNEIENLEEIRNHPVNINKADLNALLIVPGLDLNLALNIIQYRNGYGPFFSIYELYSIKEIPKNAVKKILPFITVSEKIIQEKNIPIDNSSAASIYIKSRIENHFHDRNESLSRSYSGSNIKQFNKILLRYNNYETGFITEKDPGERSYLDFWTFHFMLSDSGPFENLIIGDYRFATGQGLIEGEPFEYSKTVDAVNPVKRKEKLIQPYNSANETGYNRGLAFSLKYRDIRLTGFYSNKYIDATPDSNTEFISSLLFSGLHRTAAELNKQNIVHEIKWGMRSEYAYSNVLRCAMFLSQTDFDKQLYSVVPYSPSGHVFKDLSFSYDFNPTSPIYITGEFAYDYNSVASINSLQIPLTKDFLCFSSIRSYPRNFISLSGYSLSEHSGKVQNELGFYNGFKLMTVYGILSVYFDQFTFPSGNNRLPVSNSGNEFLIGYSNLYFDIIDLKLNYKYEDKGYLLNDDQQTYIGRRLKNDIRFTIIWNLLKDFIYKSTIEYTSIWVVLESRKEQGILIGNSIDLSLSNNLRFAWSFSFFKTNSYLSSVYDYESYTNGLLTGRVLYGDGLKQNFLLQYKLFNNIGLSIQYNEMFKPKDSIFNPAYSILANGLIIQLDMCFN